MNLEALPKYYSPKSPKLSDDAPATGSGGLTITDVMAAQGMVQSSTAWVCLIPGKSWCSGSSVCD